jgi:polyisoprenoid-binding protein YceI
MDENNPSASNHTTSDVSSSLVQTAPRFLSQTISSQMSAHTLRTFTIIPEQSEVRFIISEELLGAPKMVVGRTNQVTGSLTVDMNDYPKTQLGQIQIDARTLETDNTFRNRTMRRSILHANKEQFRYIFFQPTEIKGFPPAINVGDTFHLQISGDLAIAGVTQAAQFAVTVTASSDVTLQGLATTTVTRAQYNLQIPSIPNVANVGEEVLLQMDFLAKSK